MNRMIRSISIIVTLMVLVSGCATKLTTKSSTSFPTLLDNQPYQLRVRSGHSIRDRTIYETASFEFGKYLAISDSGSHRGVIEIIYVGMSEDSFLDTTTDFTTSSVIGNAWYIGTGYIELPGSDATREGDSTSARTSIPEDITMRINIKGSQEEQLWTADYKHKTDFERAVFTTDTERKAAKLSIKKIVEKLKEDFPAIDKSTR